MGEGWKLMRRQRRRSFHHCDAVLYRLLHLLEGTRAYLAHALARDAELVGELLERDRFFGEPACLEDAPLPVVERGERRGERLAAVFRPPPPRRGPAPAHLAPSPPAPPPAARALPPVP